MVIKNVVDENMTIHDYNGKINVRILHILLTWSNEYVPRSYLSRKNATKLHDYNKSIALAICLRFTVMLSITWRCFSWSNCFSRRFLCSLFIISHILVPSTKSRVWYVMSHMCWRGGIVKIYKKFCSFDPQTFSFTAQKTSQWINKKIL